MIIDDIISVTSHSLLLLLPPSLLSLLSLLHLLHDLRSTSAIDDDDDDDDIDDIAARLSPKPFGLVEGMRASDSESGLERFIIVGMSK